MISASWPFIQLIASVLVTTTALLTSSGCNRQPDTIKLGEFASMTGKEAVFGQNVNKGKWGEEAGRGSVGWSFLRIGLSAG